MDEPAFALIMRFGNGGWMKAGSFWQGQNMEGAAGYLQLGINDDNPYNGQPRNQWTVRVRVNRRGAGAAGIFV